MPFAMARREAKVTLSICNGTLMAPPDDDFAAPSAPVDLAALMPELNVPVGWTFAALAGGVVAGLALAGTPHAAGAIALAQPLGALWVRGLQMTIVPLVAALLVVGIVQTVAAAEAGAIARRTLAWFIAVLGASGLAGVLLTPFLLDLWPIPARAAAALSADGGSPGPVPGLADFLAAVVPENVIDAAARGAVLPVVVFFALFAVAITRLPIGPRQQLTGLFAGIAGAMMVMIGWVLRLAPLGVFALGLAVAARSGGAAVGALAHYIAVVTATGSAVFIAAYAVAVWGGGLRLGQFVRAMLPVQALALSTQSSLASMPAMLGASRALGLRPASAEFVLPLAVALFRATGPAMNLAVACYVARLTGVALTPPVLMAGLAVALVLTFGTVSLPGSISFITSVAPITLAMGVPVGPLALLLAVEMLPDLMRTVGNVTMDVAVTATIDRSVAASRPLY
jgi:hypothetical protein